MAIPPCCLSRRHTLTPNTCFHLRPACCFFISLFVSLLIHITGFTIGFGVFLLILGTGETQKISCVFLISPGVICLSCLSFIWAIWVSWILRVVFLCLFVYCFILLFATITNIPDTAAVTSWLLSGPFISYSPIGFTHVCIYPSLGYQRCLYVIISSHLSTITYYHSLSLLVIA